MSYQSPFAIPMSQHVLRRASEPVLPACVTAENSLYDTQIHLTCTSSTSCFHGTPLESMVLQILHDCLSKQNHVYMPSVPPFSRSEELADYERLCVLVKWH